jgi:hypothetical protein
LYTGSKIESRLLPVKAEWALLVPSPAPRPLNGAGSGFTVRVSVGYTF